MATQSRLFFPARAAASAAAALVPYEPPVWTHIGHKTSGVPPDSGAYTEPVAVPSPGTGYYVYIRPDQRTGDIEALADAVTEVEVPDRGRRPDPDDRPGGRPLDGPGRQRELNR